MRSCSQGLDACQDVYSLLSIPKHLVTHAILLPIPQPFPLRKPQTLENTDDDALFCCGQSSTAASHTHHRSSSTEKSLPWRSTDVPNTGIKEPGLSDTVHPNNDVIRTALAQGTLYSPAQTSLHERSLGTSRSPTKMNSYSKSRYQ
ncbi:hypothetical protein GH733_009557 [Mirounga leonina]|nr:hypothetical protein GH733_009557 [Mirounga leonina]